MRVDQLIQSVMLLVGCLCALPVAAQVTVAPYVGPWEYREFRCHSAQTYSSESDAIESGIQRAYGGPCGAGLEQDDTWPTGAPGDDWRWTCGAQKQWLPYKRMGIEYFNHKHITAWMNVGDQCQVRVTDGLNIERERAVSCPRGYSQSGDVCVRALGGVDWGKNNSTCDAGCNGTNPIHPSLGTKLQTELDFVLPGGLRFERYYSSAPGFESGRLGKNWRSSLDYYVALVEPQTSGAPTTAWVQRPNGDRFYFNRDGAGSWVPDPDVVLKLEAVYDGTTLTGWIIENRTAREIYSADGFIQEIAEPSGVTTFHYSKGRLVSVSDRVGRSLSISYDVANRISAVQDPAGNSYVYQYDSLGRHTSVTYPSAPGEPPQVRQYLFESSGHTWSLTGILDEAGQRFATWEYGSQSRGVLSYHGSSGQIDRVQITYGANGSSTATNSLGEIRSFSFTNIHGVAKLQAASRACPGCATLTESRTYDVNGHPDVVAAGGKFVDSDYDSLGRLIRNSEGSSPSQILRVTENDWDGALYLMLESRVIEAGALVSKSAWTYNSRGQVLTSSRFNVQDTDVRTTSHAYCEQTELGDPQCPKVGLLKWIDGPKSGSIDRTLFDYFGSVGQPCSSNLLNCGYLPGDVWKVTDPSGAVTEVLAYDPSGRPLAVLDPNGIITETTYYPRGWISTITVKGLTPSDDRLTTYEYWPNGLVKKVTGPDGIYSSFEYDDAHRLIAIADGIGNRIEYTLDAVGNRIAENTKDPGGVLKRTLSRVYNTLGQLVTQADAQSNPTDFTYDARGNVDTIESALGSVTDNSYDPLSRLIRTLQDVGGIEAETKFEYDANDNLTKVTDPKGLDTTYTYNGFGDLVQLSSPDTGVTTYTYDSAGNRASQTDARGITTTYQYDALNRLTQVGYPTSSLNVSYTYDVTQPVCQAGETFSVGRLTLMVDGSGSTQYCHDRFGQVVRKVQTTNGVALTLQYAYTKGGQLQAMTYPDGTVVDYVRNAQGQITEVGVAQPGQAREVLLTQATYHPFGPIAGWVYGNGRVMQRNVDLDYRPTSIQGGAGGLDLTYGYDAVGNLTNIASGSPPPLEYGYDALGRLTESRDGPTQAVIDQYTYDKTGNRTSFTDSLGTRTYAYPFTSHHLSSVDGESRTYDAVGNTLSIGTAREFDYNDAGRMSEVRNGGVVAMEYAYNGRGEQVRKHLGPSETQALYDEAGHWLGDYGTTGVALQQAVWMDDMPVGASAAGKLHYVLPDHLGAPRLVVEPASDVAIWGWDSKGEVFGSTSPDQDLDGDGTQFILGMRFPGQIFESESELNQNYHRDYEPATGRYATSDPLGLIAGLSTYSYAFSSPLVFFDSDGLQARAIRLPGTVPPGTSPQLDQWGTNPGPTLSWEDIGQFVENAWEVNKHISGAGVAVTLVQEACGPPDDECNRLNSEVRLAKASASSLGKCYAGMSRWQLTVRVKAWLRLAEARSRLNVRCFSGGDLNHQQALQQVWTVVSNCQALL